jgi:P27 family predicted phage terminase small subunit
MDRMSEKEATIMGNFLSGRRKPTRLKIVTGNPGKRPLPKNEPMPEVSLPEPPAHLDEEARAEWARAGRELYRLGLLSNLDRAVFAAYCEAWSQFVFCQRKLQSMAETDATGSGALVLRTKKDGHHYHNPFVSIARAAQRDLMVLSDRLGMNPSARARIDVEAAGRAQAKDPAEKYFEDR